MPICKGFDFVLLLGAETGTAAGAADARAAGAAEAGGVAFATGALDLADAGGVATGVRGGVVPRGVVAFVAAAAEAEGVAGAGSAAGFVAAAAGRIVVVDVPVGCGSTGAAGTTPVAATGGASDFELAESFIPPKTATATTRIAAPAMSGMGVRFGAVVIADVANAWVVTAATAGASCLSLADCKLGGGALVEAAGDTRAAFADSIVGVVCCGCAI
jgi:hypothetical protein